MAVRWLNDWLHALHDRLHAEDAAESQKYWEDRGHIYSEPMTAGTYAHVTVDPSKYSWSLDSDLDGLGKESNDAIGPL